jgi:Flp pilus assembly protein TadG
MKNLLGLRRESGATLVEFAIVAPVFFMMLFGIIEMGLAFHNRIVVDDAVQEAGRLGSALGNDIDTDIEILDRLAAQITSLPAQTSGRT